MTKRLLPILIFLIVGLRITAQTVNDTILYTGALQQGCSCLACNVDNWCINSQNCGSTSACDSKTFQDPVPPGNIITGVTVTYYGAGCDATSEPTYINGVLIGNAPNDGDCSCGACNAYPVTHSFPCPTGLPSYNYGGSNIFKCCPNAAFCPQKAIIKFTYTSASVAATSIVANPAFACGGPITLKHIGGSLGTGASWKWYSGSCGGTLVGTGDSITVTPTSTTTYFVRAEGGSCGSTACVQLTVQAKTPSVAPASASASPATTCGGATNLSVTGGSLGTGAVWKWYSGSCGGTSVGSGAALSVSPTTSTTYFVRAEGDCNNTTCVSVAVTVNPVPFAIATPSSQTICSGNNASIALSSFTLGTTFAWTVTQNGVSGASSGFGNSISNVLTTTGAVNGTAIYSIVPTANGCVGNPVFDTVVVKPKPVIVVTPPAQTVCAGALPSCTLSSAVAGTQFSWTVVQNNVTGAHNGSGTSIADTLVLNGNLPGTAIYTITASANGCTASAVLDTVTVNPEPGSAVTITPMSSTICSGFATAISLSSSIPGTQFAWTVNQTGATGATAGSGNSIAQTLTTTGLSSGTVTYLVTPVSNGCSGTTIPVNVLVKPSPSGSATPSSQTFCSGNSTSISLTSNTSGANFNWTVFQSGGVSGASFGSGTSITQVLTNTGNSTGMAIYLITPTANGCSGSVLRDTVLVNPIDNASFSYSSATYCLSGNDPSPVITGLLGGVFSSSPSGLALDATTGVIDLSACTVGAYTLTYTTNGTCPNSSSITINISSATFSAGFNYQGSPYCQNNSTNPLPVFDVGAIAGSFTATPSGLSFVQSNTGQINLAASMPGSYVVTNTIPASGSCPAVTATSTVVIVATDNASFAYSSAVYCSTAADQSPVSVVQPGGVFSVAPIGLALDSLSGLITLSSSNAGIYSVTYATNGQCPNSSTINISVDTTVASAAFSYPGTPFCTNSNNAFPLFDPNAGAGVFSASPSGLSFVNANTGEINIGASLTGTYIVTNTIPSNGSCPSTSATSSVIINPIPVASASPASLSYCQTGNVPVSVVLSSSISGSNFSWTVVQSGLSGATAGSGNAISQTLINSSGSPGDVTYSIIASANGCSSNPLLVNIAVYPTVVDTSSVLIIVPQCIGMNTGAINNMVVNSGNAPFTYQWFDSSTTPVGNGSADLTGVGPGIYSLVITNGANCQVNLGPYTITVPQVVTASFTTDVTTGLSPLDVNFMNTSTGAISYYWSFGTGDTSNLTNPSYQYLEPAAYTACLVATNALNCTDTSCIVIDVVVDTVFIIPNVFSPNGDGVNDIFAVNITGLKSMHAEIYNRWGEKIFEWSTLSGGWDGRSASGQKASAGTYYYLINAKGGDGEQYVKKGAFSLVDSK